MITIRVCLAAVLLGAAVVSADQVRLRRAPAAAIEASSNSFYEYLIGRAELSECRSWRPIPAETNIDDCDYKDQLLRIGGGFNGDLSAASYQHGLYVSYDFAGDDDPEKQDATRITIPNWMGADNDLQGVLEDAMDTSTTSVNMKASYTGGPYGLTYTPSASFYSTPTNDIRIGNEIMTVVSYNTSTHTITVNRAQHGSTAASHSVNDLVQVATLSLQTQLRHTISLTEGQTGFWFSEFFPTASFVNPDFVYPGAHKTWQIYAGHIFIEPQTDYSNASVLSHGSRACYTRYTHAFNTRTRVYHDQENDHTNTTWSSAIDTEIGPGFENVSEDLQPQSGNATEYCGLPSRWHRMAIRYKYITADWTQLDIWFWDKDRNPVRVVNAALIGGTDDHSPSTRETITEWWEEWNVSHEEFEFGTVANIDDFLRVYIKNFVFLKVTGAASSGPLSDDDILNTIFVRSDVRPCGVTYAC